VVSTDGGPKEIIADGVTGVVLPGDDATRWCQTIDELLSDELRLARMSRNAPQRATRNSLQSTFEHFWEAHASAATPREADSHTPNEVSLPAAAVDHVDATL
jgi:glycosyltransferase involved in cell wall biosynthesis